jgi:hypothetical protein
VSSPYNANVAALHHVDLTEFDVCAEMDKVVGNLDDFEITGQQILVGAFVRPVSDKLVTRSGVVLLKATTEVGRDASEDAVQGKVVRVLKIGPQAFPPEYVGEWGDRGPPKVGDWLLTEPQTGVQLSVKCSGSVGTEMFKGADSKRLAGHGGWPCRLMFAKDILGRLREPHLVV